MDFNLSCNNLKNDIINLISTYNLPIAAVYYIYKDVFSSLEQQYIATINGLLLSQQPEEEILKPPSSQSIQQKQKANNK